MHGVVKTIISWDRKKQFFMQNADYRKSPTQKQTVNRINRAGSKAVVVISHLMGLGLICDYSASF